MAHTIVGMYGGEIQDRDFAAGSGGASPSHGTGWTWRSPRNFAWNLSGSTGFLALYGLTSASQQNAFPSWGYVTLSAHMNIATLPGSSIEWFTLYRGDRSPVNGRDEVRLTDQGEIEILQEGTVEATSTGTLATSTDYLLSIVRSPGSLQVIVRDESGSEVINVTNGASDTGAVRPLFGPVETSHGHVRFDNLVWEGSTSAGNTDDPYDLLGFDYVVDLGDPNGTGTDDSNWNGSYLDLDERPFDEDTTRRELLGQATGVFTEEIEDQFASAGVGRIHAVLAFARIRSQGNGFSSNVNIRLRSGSTIQDESSKSLNGSTSWENYAPVYTTDPDTGSAWTVGSVYASEVGFRRSTSPGGNNDVYCTAVLVQMLYTVGGAPNRIIALF